MRRGVLVLSAVLVCLAVFAPAARSLAQTGYPTRPVEVIIPYPPGGVSDTGIRYYADKWGEFLGQPIVPVNKPGGGSTLGAKFVATAAPDGYTLLAGSDSPLITARFGVKGIGYDLDSFRMVFQYSKLALFFSVKADSKWKTLEEFLRDAKKGPGELRYASYGIGAITHYATELLSQAAGVKLTYVPFKSSPESLTALMGGHVELAVTAGLAGMAGSPRIRPVAVASETRLPDYPDVPTLKELGYAVVVDSTVLLAAPSGVPDEVVRKFTAAHVKALAKYESDIKAKMPKLNQYPDFVEGEPLMKVLRERERKYRELAPQMGIKLE